MTVRAIDPPDCGCTECIVGEYVPVRSANAADVARMFTGDASNHTGMDVALEIEWDRDGNVTNVTARFHYKLYVSEFSTYRFDLTGYWPAILRVMSKEAVA